MWNFKLNCPECGAHVATVEMRHVRPDYSVGFGGGAEVEDVEEGELGQCRATYDDDGETMRCDGRVTEEDAVEAFWNSDPFAYAGD